MVEEGKRMCGRPQRRLTQDVADWVGDTVTGSGRMVQDRNLFQLAVREAVSGTVNP